MANDVTMTYGSYEFDPVPIMTLKKNLITVGNREEHVGVSFTITLNGTLTPLPDHGITNIDTLQDELRNALKNDGKKFELKCGATTLLLTYPKITSELEFLESNNNWTLTSPYTVELTFEQDDQAEDENFPAFIESYSEDWQVELVQEHRNYSWDLSQVVDQKAGHDYPTNDTNNLFNARVTHNINVKGLRTFSGDGVSNDGEMTSAVDNALDFIHNWTPNNGTLLGYDIQYGHGLTGIFNMGTGVNGYPEYYALDHFRTSSINETEGSVSITENWTVVNRPSGITENRAIEDFDISLRSSNDSGLTSVSINGTVQGLEDRDYAHPTGQYNIATTGQAYVNASGYWSEIKNRILPRCQLIYEADGGSAFINKEPVSRSVGHNPSRGNITYSYEFDTRPCSMITGALVENFTINNTHPHDIFTTLTVLGRPLPIHQGIGATTARRREITIECVMPGPTGCTSVSDLDLNKPTTNVENILCEFQTQLTDNYAQVFKDNDTENWNPISGRYSRSVGWTFADCSGNVSTSFC